MPGQIWPVKLGTLYLKIVIKNARVTIFLCHDLGDFVTNPSNSTGRIGCKSIEIMSTKFDQALITGQIG